MGRSPPRPPVVFLKVRGRPTRARLCAVLNLAGSGDDAPSTRLMQQLFSIKTASRPHPRRDHHLQELADLRIDG